MRWPWQRDAVVQEDSVVRPDAVRPPRVRSRGPWTASEPLDLNGPAATRRRKRVLELLLACAAALIPWTAFLAVSLPDQYRAHHWRLTWAGFDGLLLVAMGLTVYFGWRRRQAVIPAAFATATLLVCDAWFDISLDLGTSDVWWSVGSAALVELPLAGFLVNRALLLIRLTMLNAYRQFGIESPPPSVLKIPLFGLSRELDSE